jgi:integrase
VGRPSTSGSRFLVKRSDSGIWAYHRNLPPDIAKGVIGEVRLYWSGRIAALTGKKVVAISLGTSDRREAERRRDQAHAQVEQIVDRAMREIRMIGMSADRIRLVPKLTPQQHRQIADWLYASALAAQDDEMAEDPDEYYDNKRVWAWLEREWAEDASKGSEAEVLARMMERRPLDPDNPDDRSRGSIVEEALEDIGVRLADPEQLRLAGLAILRARRRAWDALQRRERGEPVETPPVEVPSFFDEKKEPGKGVQGPLLRETFEDFVRAKGMKPHTAADYRNQLERFIDLNDNIPVAAVTRRMVLDFALAMEKYPARFPDAWRGKRVQDIIDLAAKRPDLRRMAPQTINDRAVGALKSFFGWCAKRRQLIEQNPAAGVALDVPKLAEKPRKPYKLEHLRLIFQQPVFVSGERERPKRGAGEAMYWLPLIALYTGARIEEIGQLRVKDVRQEDGIWVFDITEDPGETALKTASSRRMIPIHRDLISRGLLAERDRQIAAGETRMFPKLVRNRENKYTAMFSKWWGLWTRSIGITDERLVFHSFRHCAKDKFRATKIPVDVQDALLGHAGLTVGSRYGDGHDVQTLDEWVQKIDWSPVFAVGDSNDDSKEISENSVRFHPADR